MYRLLYGGPQVPTFVCATIVLLYFFNVVWYAWSLDGCRHLWDSYFHNRLLEFPVQGCSRLLKSGPVT